MSKRFDTKVHLLVVSVDIAYNLRVGLKHRDSLFFICNNNRLRILVIVVCKTAICATDFVYLYCA